MMTIRKEAKIRQECKFGSVVTKSLFVDHLSQCHLLTLQSIDSKEKMLQIFQRGVLIDSLTSSTVFLCNVTTNCRRIFRK